MIQEISWTRKGAPARLEAALTRREVRVLQLLLLERIEPKGNIYRYYVLAIEPTLFGDMALRREWGRIGSPRGARRLELHADDATAKEALKAWLRRKQQRGYLLKAADAPAGSSDQPGSGADHAEAAPACHPTEDHWLDISYELVESSPNSPRLHLRAPSDFD